MPKANRGSGASISRGVPGRKAHQKRAYPTIDIAWVTRNVVFLPNLWEIQMMIGITRNVVQRAPTDAKKPGQLPAAPASPSKR